MATISGMSLGGLDATEQGYLDGVTAGTVTASKAVVVDANKDVASLRDATFRKVKIGDSANDHTITIEAGGDEAANRTVTVPALGGNATLAFLGLNQTFTGNNVHSGTFTQGSDATDRVAVKGIYMSPANVAVTVPAIIDHDIAKVDVNVASAFSMQPAVGDAVIAIPQEAMETNARILGCYVTATDQITVVFGSEGGNVAGGAKNFKFLVMDLT